MTTNGLTSWRRRLPGSSAQSRRALVPRQAPGCYQLMPIAILGSNMVTPDSPERSVMTRTDHYSQKAWTRGRLTLLAAAVTGQSALLEKPVLASRSDAISRVACPGIWIATIVPCLTFQAYDCHWGRSAFLICSSSAAILSLIPLMAPPLPSASNDHVVPDHTRRKPCPCSKKALTSANTSVPCV